MQYVFAVERFDSEQHLDEPKGDYFLVKSLRILLESL